MGIDVVIVPIHYCLSTTQQHANVDGKSRLPLPETPQKTSVPPEFVLMVQKLDGAPITAPQIAAWTQQDQLLCDVLRYIQDVWPDSENDELTSYAGCGLEE